MPPDSESTFFFYGTLMAQAVLSRVLFGSSKPDTLSTTHRPLAKPLSAILTGYQRSRVKFADYPAIFLRADACVQGFVVTGLTQGDIWRLDVFEGDEYERHTVKVKILGEIGAAGEGEEWNVQTYVWVSGKQRLEEQEWDFDTFKREKLWRWSGEESNADGLYTGNYSSHIVFQDSNV
jgi:Gamma-glutamyl cyclotransferase, AIG2-like